MEKEIYTINTRSFLTEYHKESLSPLHFDEILKISNRQFGQNYICINDLEMYLRDQNYRSLVGIYKNKVVGFIIIKVCDVKGIADELYLGKDFTKNTFTDHQPIALIKQTAVASPYTGKGIGSDLLKSGISMIKNSVKSIVSIVWVNNFNKNGNDPYNSYNFKLLCRIHEYWKDESLRKKYSCAICGKPPCFCSALIYIKYL